jgi:hypothetical protein
MVSRRPCFLKDPSMSRTKPPEQFFNQSRLLTQKTLVKPVTLSLPSAHPLQHRLITALDEDRSLRFVVGVCGTKPPAPQLSV